MTSAPKKPSADQTPQEPADSQPMQEQSLDEMLAKAFSVRTSTTPAADAPPVESQRCGLIAIVGKPNVGKS
ncbi:MAG: GTPase Era, partial [Pseudomonadota bacterium]